jgi:hypothetical protein
MESAMPNSGAGPGAGDLAIRNLTELLRRMSPRRRTQLIRFLERASDNPFLAHPIRQRTDRYLLAIKDILRFEQLVEHACEEFVSRDRRAAGGRARLVATQARADEIPHPNPSPEGTTLFFLFCRDFRVAG